MNFIDTIGANSEIHQFLFNGYLNGMPTWISDDNLYDIYWSTGTTNQWLVDGWSNGIIYNSNTSTPPLTGWQFLGGSYSGSYVITVLEGVCVNNPMINMSINVNKHQLVVIMVVLLLLQMVEHRHINIQLMEELRINQVQYLVI
jgi:hypothetical protein